MKLPTSPHPNLIEQARNLLNPDISEIAINLSNNDFPLSERWSAYAILIENGVLNKTKGYGDGFLHMLKSTEDPSFEYNLYDHFFMDRGQTKKFIDLYERIEEFDAYNIDVPTAESVAQWQECILSSGYSQFTYDW